MRTVAQGDGNPAGEGRGYNAPSLLGLGTGAPYLHGGNARTLEGLLGTAFDGHHRAVAANFLTQSDAAARAAQVQQLVTFLLAVDEDTTPVEGVKLGAQGGLLCPTVP